MPTENLQPGIVRPNGKDVSIYQADATVGEMKLWRAPEAVLAEAKQAADALQRVIQGSKIKPIKFGENEHLRHEHWQTLGHFYGYCTKIESTKYLEFGEVTGYEATALLINEHTGQVVGRVDSMCLDDEEQWGEVAEYEWQDTFTASGAKAGKHRVQVGTKAKPLFQIRSMAETRASAKAFRTKLAWVAVLAGYAPTPAEEMRRDTTGPENQPAPLPAKLERKTAPVAQPLTPAYPPKQAQSPVNQPRTAPVRVISEAKARRFYAIWKSGGKSREQVSNYLRSRFGIERDLDIPEAAYNEACKWAETA
jgi:hypothetical protein